MPADLVKAVFVVVALGLLTCSGKTGNQEPQSQTSWEKGVFADPHFFPIAAWCQDPQYAREYKEIGVNLFVGLWAGPTEKQLEQLRAAGLYTICGQNQTGLKHLDDTLIAGWMWGDEPDNAQPKRGGGWDPCIKPEEVHRIYQRIKQQDPSRPTYLNFGKGVAHTDWVGRGECTGKTEMYRDYLKACDIASYDIYPVNDDDRKVHGQLWYVAKGIDSLLAWSDHKKPVWCWIECTKIGHYSRRTRKPTVDEVRAEVWMALVHGAAGFGYFCHVFGRGDSCISDHGCLEDPPMKEGMGQINHQVLGLAPVLNSPTIPAGARAVSSNPAVPVDIMVKKYEGATYLFAVAMREGAATVEFNVAGLTAGTAVEVLDEGRTLTTREGSFNDDFSGYAVHLYKISGGE